MEHKRGWLARNQAKSDEDAGTVMKMMHKVI
jgi:hypothetical protein